MLATLHLPTAAPRALTTAELAALHVHSGPGQHLVVRNEGAVMRQLLDTALDYDVMANGPAYLVLVIENAADLDLPVNLSADAEVARLTGVDFADEPLVGPVLVIEA